MTSVRRTSRQVVSAALNLNFRDRIVWQLGFSSYNFGVCSKSHLRWDRSPARLQAVLQPQDWTRSFAHLGLLWELPAPLQGTRRDFWRYRFWRKGQTCLNDRRLDACLPACLMFGGFSALSILMVLLNLMPGTL